MLFIIYSENIEVDDLDEGFRRLKQDLIQAKNEPTLR